MSKIEYHIETMYSRWETTTVEDTPEEAEKMLADYRRNQPEYVHRIRKVEIDEGAPTYKIVRVFQRDDEPSEVLARHLTLEEAQHHCNSPETSSETAQSSEARTRTIKFGRWFDQYVQE